MHPESSQGGAQSWRSGCSSNTPELPKKGAGTWPLKVQGRAKQGNFPTDPFDWGLGFPGGSDGKESAGNAGYLGSILGLGRSPGGGHGNPLQYFCLENPHGQGSLVSYSPWGRKELDTTERLSTAQHKEFCFYLYFAFFIFWPCHSACGTSVSRPGIESGPWQ